VKTYAIHCDISITKLHSAVLLKLADPAEEPVGWIESWYVREQRVKKNRVPLMDRSWFWIQRSELLSEEEEDALQCISTLWY
jgi:hypothetical protein